MTRYRKSWTQVLQEVREGCKDCQCDPCECATPGEDHPEGHEPQGIDDQYMEESAALQLKMAFDDAKIKIKGTKGGKLVIDKKDKKKVEKVIAKQMKKPEDAKRVLGSQIVFEEVELDEKFAGWIAFYNKEKLEIKPKKGVIDSLNDAKQAAIKHFKVPKSKQGLLAIEPAHEEIEEKIDMKKAGYGGSRHKKIEKDKYNTKRKGQGMTDETELTEKGTAYPATVDTLRKIVKDKQHQTVMFDKGQALVDLFSASAMVQVYDALKPATKKKFEAMIKSKEGFMKSQAFAMKMAK